MFLQKLNNQISNTLSIIFKSSCILCKAEISRNNNLCALCWNNMEFISDPRCDICGSAMDFAESGINKCQECIVVKRSFDKARAVAKFNDHSAKIIHNFKYYDQIQLSKKIAKLMYSSGKELIKEADLICSVPIHKSKIFERKYNQSHLLAYYIAKYGKKLQSLDNSILIRTRNTNPQSMLSRARRKENVKKAFAVKAPHLVMNKHILLIDDVITTGSTISECTTELKNAGARKIFILTFAKT